MPEYFYLISAAIIGIIVGASISLAYVIFYLPVKALSFELARKNRSISGLVTINEDRLMIYLYNHGASAESACLTGSPVYLQLCGIEDTVYVVVSPDISTTEKKVISLRNARICGMFSPASKVQPSLN